MNLKVTIFAVFLLSMSIANAFAADTTKPVINTFTINGGSAYTQVQNPSLNIIASDDTVACPVNLTWNSTRKTCESPKTCVTGTVYDAFKNACTATPTMVCPSGTTYNAQEMLCVNAPSCPSGSTYNVTLNKCTTVTTPCAPNFTWDNTNSVCLANPTCTVVGTTFYEYIDKCIVIPTNSCPAGTTLNTSVAISYCEVPQTCPSGSTFNTSLNICSALPLGLTMSFSNDNTTWSAWEAYANAKLWTLTTGNGSKTVYARIKDAAGNISLTSSKTINFDNVKPVITGTTYGPSGNTITVAINSATDLNGIKDVSYGSATSPWTAYIPYVPGAGYNATNLVPAGDGSRTVYAKVRDNALNESLTKSFTVIRDTTGPTGSVVINGGAATTATTAITLTLSATDATTAVSKMQFSFNNSTWTTLEAYATTKALTLPTGDGLKTVYVKFTDSRNNYSAVYSDTITLGYAVTAISSVTMHNVPNPPYTQKDLWSFIAQYSSVGATGIKEWCISETTTCTTWKPWWNGVPIDYSVAGKSDGPFNLYYSVRDNNGATSLPYTIPVHIDRIAPVKNPSTPVGAHQLVNNNVVITWSGVTDTISAVKHQVLKTNKPITGCTDSNYSAMIIYDSGWITGSDADRLTASYPIEKGNKTYHTVCAYDKAGNVITMYNYPEGVFVSNFAISQVFPGVNLGDGTTGIGLSLSANTNYQELFISNFKSFPYIFTNLELLKVDVNSQTNGYYAISNVTEKTGHQTMGDYGDTQFNGYIIRAKAIANTQYTNHEIITIPTVFQVSAASATECLPGTTYSGGYCTNFNRRAKLIYRESGTGVSQVLYETPNEVLSQGIASKGVSVAIVANPLNMYIDNIYVAYIMHDELRLAVRSNGVWSDELIAMDIMAQRGNSPLPEALWGVSMVVDSSGIPAIAYVSDKDGIIRLVKKTGIGGVWTTSTIFDGPSVAAYPAGEISLSIDNNGNYHTVWSEGLPYQTNSLIRYSFTSGGVWSNPSVVDYITFSSTLSTELKKPYCSPTIKSTFGGVVKVAYYDAQQGIKLAVLNGISVAPGFVAVPRITNTAQLTLVNPILSVKLLHNAGTLVTLQYRMSFDDTPESGWLTLAEDSIVNIDTTGLLLGAHVARLRVLGTACSVGFNFNIANGACEASPVCDFGTFNIAYGFCETPVIAPNMCPSGFSYNTFFAKCIRQPMCTSGVYNSDKCTGPPPITNESVANIDFVKK